MTDKKDDASNVMAFDALYTTNQIQKLKVLLPYIEPSMQKHLAVYIKYMELQYTIQFTKKHTATLCGCGLSQPDVPRALPLLNPGGDPAVRADTEHVTDAGNGTGNVPDHERHAGNFPGHEHGIPV